jgi:hypothetical protein
LPAFTSLLEVLKQGTSPFQTANILGANQAKTKSDVVLSLNDGKMIWRKDNARRNLTPFLLGKERVYFMDAMEQGDELAACSLQTGELLYCTTLNYPEQDHPQPNACTFTPIQDGNDEILLALQAFSQSAFYDESYFVYLINGATCKRTQYPLACGAVSNAYIQTMCEGSTTCSPVSFRVIGGLRGPEDPVMIAQQFSKRSNGAFDIKNVEAIAMPAGFNCPEFHRSALVGWCPLDVREDGCKAFKIAQSSDPVFHKELGDAVTEACCPNILGIDRSFRVVEVVDFLFPEGIHPGDCSTLSLLTTGECLLMWERIHVFCCGLRGPARDLESQSGEPKGKNIITKIYIIDLQLLLHIPASRTTKAVLIELKRRSPGPDPGFSWRSYHINPQRHRPRPRPHTVIPVLSKVVACAGIESIDYPPQRPYQVPSQFPSPSHARQS